MRNERFCLRDPYLLYLQTEGRRFHTLCVWCARKRNKNIVSASFKAASRNLSTFMREAAARYREKPIIKCLFKSHICFWPRNVPGELLWIGHVTHGPRWACGYNQLYFFPCHPNVQCCVLMDVLQAGRKLWNSHGSSKYDKLYWYYTPTVSYTHLTLPTKA